MTQLALVIDLNVCVGCHACVTSCKEWNTSGIAGALVDERPYERDPTGTFFNRVQTFEIGEYPDTQTVHFPKSCLHCEDPPCVPVCPTGASYKRAEDGIVLVDYDKCIGCKYCAWACPYGVRELDEKQRVMKKCTLCVDRIYDQALPAEERKPACVMACPTNARLFGDIHDPDSQVAVAIREQGGYALMPEWGTRPANHYLPRRKTEVRITPEQLQRADNPLTRDGKLPKPPQDSPSLDDTTSLVIAPSDPRVRPAYSVVFLTTLIGVGQGLFLALYAVDVGARFGEIAAAAPRLFTCGAGTAAVFVALGLVASFFHLGRPERAWRAAAQWRTSWLSREVIVLPAFLAGVVAWGTAHWFAWSALPTIGIAAFVACIALFVCTGMVYACIKFLQEWASPWTLVNLFLLGAASGTTLATALAAWIDARLVALYAPAAIVLTLAALAGRCAALARNARLRPRSSLQSAIGIKHPRIAQKAQGFMGGSFNTREFFHGASPRKMRAIRRGFLVATFVLPVLLLAAGLASGARPLYAVAFVVQYAGLLAERWYFLAQANHPQNLYYQAMS